MASQAPQSLRGSMQALPTRPRDSALPSSRAVLLSDSATRTGLVRSTAGSTRLDAATPPAKAMQPPLRMAVLLAAILFATAADALFTPRCLWSGLLGDLGSSGESGERWIRDTSFRTQDSRVRRFLWTDKDVCDWMCRGDYGSEVRDICSRCCPGSTQQTSATSRRPQTSPMTPSSPSPTSAGTSRAPRTTVSEGTPTAPTSGAPTATSGAPTPPPGAPTATSGAPTPTSGAPA